MSQATQTRSTAQPQPQHHRSLAEWVTFGVAALILSMIAGLVMYDWIATPPTPPVLSLTQSGEVRQEHGQFYVPFTISNTGGDTAASVQIIAELRINGSAEESGEQQIDFLAGAESEEGAFVFSRNPQEGELVLRVASYMVP